MLQESATTAWDLRNMTVELPAGEKLYLVYLLVVCIVTSMNLARVWRSALPFTLARLKPTTGYIQLLDSAACSLKQWFGLTLLVWALSSSLNVYRLCNRILDDRRLGDLVLVFLVREFSTILSLTLLICLLVFLARWHILTRLAKLRG